MVLGLMLLLFNLSDDDSVVTNGNSPKILIQFLFELERSGAYVRGKKHITRAQSSPHVQRHVYFTKENDLN